MPRVIQAQQNFNSGELSSGLRNRFNLQIYYNGVERMSNFIPTKEGNAKYRNGLPYVATVKSSNVVRGIDFVSSSGNRYLLEFTDSFCRIYKDNVLLQTIASPYLEADLFNIKKDVEGDNVYLVDNNHIPYRLVKTSSTTFTLSRVDYDSTIPPYRPENISSTTITASGLSGTVTLTASSALFNANDVGRYVKIRSGSNDGFARITVFTSTTVVTAVTKADFPVTGPTTNWTLSTLPNAVAFYESRLVYGKNNFINWSRAPDDQGVPRYEDFELGTNVDDGLFTSSGKFGNEIRWLIGTDRMLAAGSYIGVFKIDSGVTEEPITISQPPSVKKIDGDGVSNVSPIQRNNNIFFVKKGGNIVNHMRFSFEADGFIIDELNELSTDIAIEVITQLAFLSGNERILFATKTNGEMIGVVWHPQQRIKAWFRFETDGLIESIAVVPTSSNKDRLFLFVNRTIESSTKRYIEYLSDDVVLPKRIDFFTEKDNEITDNDSYLIDVFEKQKDWNFLDSTIAYDGSDQSVTMTPSAITGDDITFTAGGAVFASGDVGREIWEKDGNGRARIITFTSTTVVKCKILSDFANTNAINAGEWFFTKATIDGLDHLEDEIVNVIRDGGRDPQPYTVVSGEITLTQQASKATIGLSYKGLIKTFNLEGGSANGSSRGKPKLINKFVVYFLNSVGSKYGTDIYDLEEIMFGPSPILGRAIPPFTGPKDAVISDTSEEEKQVYIVQDSPLACIVQAIVPEYETNEA